MFEPPSSHVDMLADAQTARAGTQELLDVPEVGELEARRPTPKSVAALAMSVNHKIKPGESAAYLTLFVIDHIGEDGYSDLLEDMIENRLPADTIGRTARAVATWGTARPYTAVATLAGITAHHWRHVRGLLADNGIYDPLNQLPTMHALLDKTERMVLESFNAEQPDAAKASRREFLNALYAPDVKTEAINGADYRPPGFEDDEIEAAFDTFARTAR